MEEKDWDRQAAPPPAHRHSFSKRQSDPQGGPDRAALARRKTRGGGKKFQDHPVPPAQNPGAGDQPGFRFLLCASAPQHGFSGRGTLPDRCAAIRRLVPERPGQRKKGGHQRRPGKFFPGPGTLSGGLYSGGTIRPLGGISPRRPEGRLSGSPHPDGAVPRADRARFGRPSPATSKPSRPIRSWKTPAAA